jgi:ubiquinone/menaquinone biosynthesis C-methylase UbiE
MDNRSCGEIDEKPIETYPMTDSWDNPAYEAALAYQRTAALTAAVKLDVFTLIGAGTATSEILSEKTGTSIRGMRILCDFLAVMGLLNKDDQTYRVTPTGRRYLDISSPAWLGSSIDFFAAPEMLSLVLDDPVSYVRRGGSNGLANLSPDNPIWIRFAKAMMPIASVTAKRTAAYFASLAEPPSMVLDVAAGHGLYGIELAKMLPRALVTAVDWGAVLALAYENANDAGVGDRFRIVAGNAFEVNWGHSFDLVLMANFLHHFGRAECIALLRKVKSSLSTKGQACVIDFIPNEDRVSPPMQAMFAFFMLATTPTGDAYTLGDLSDMAKDAGFSCARARPLRPTPQTLVLFET